MYLHEGSEEMYTYMDSQVDLLEGKTHNFE